MRKKTRVKKMAGLLRPACYLFMSWRLHFNLLSLFFIYHVIQWVDRSYVLQPYRSSEIDVTPLVPSTVPLSYFSEHFSEKIMPKSLNHQSLSAISVRSILQKLYHTEHVAEAKIYKTWKGKLCMKIKPYQPIARFGIAGDKPYYLTKEGKEVPVLTGSPARVVVVTGASYKAIKLTNYRTHLLELLNYIDTSSYWKAQIMQIHIMPDGDLLLYPQVGNYTIEFGKPVQIEQKIKKLALFYKRILPRRGWRAYKRVNLTFCQQIVCA